MLTNLFNSNLDFWKNKSWLLEDIFKYNKKYKRNRGIVLITIKNQEIHYDFVRRSNIFTKVIKFLNDIIKLNKFKNLDVSFLLDLSDEPNPMKLETYDFRTNKNDNKNKNNHKFSWGISESSSDIIKIENGYFYNIDFPIFSFNKNHDGYIVFPHFNLLNKSYINFSNDTINDIDFYNKISNKPIYRFSNFRASLFKPSRIKLALLSFKNPKYIDCKGSHNGPHPGHGQYILHKTFIKLYSHLKIIKLNEHKFDSFMEYFNVNNYIPKDEFKKYKYLVTNDSWYNNIDYCMWNSILFRYNLEKCKYYEDFIFEDGTDVVIFDEKNFKEKIDGIRNTSPEILVKNIENRKKKVKEYLFYDKLVDHYGQLLMKFSEIQKNNQL